MSRPPWPAAAWPACATLSAACSPLRKRHLPHLPRRLLQQRFGAHVVLEL
eukprot:CAMPEP_0196694034 /NCGR_PEP_ID=MMETSP1090-20130531/32475_1 /TAXON_ID=37098 /ORGANISM="Isochrysis sp, Strain CCMP1244" /LENGTH=49 /DNA_ID= /DNA_START= /DNA_END= /DNA_ORIENTATION=